jgi:hypothetical protein
MVVTLTAVPLMGPTIGMTENLDQLSGLCKVQDWDEAGMGALGRDQECLMERRHKAERCRLHLQFANSLELRFRLHAPATIGLPYFHDSTVLYDWVGGL